MYGAHVERKPRGVRGGTPPRRPRVCSARRVWSPHEWSVG
jgi:hypothetical protein